MTAMADSMVAQGVADREGPGASIRAEFANVSGVRRVVASFHLNADAYVLVGHIDADGVLRIAFPLEPGDDGFVRGNRDYRTPEFFAGFTDQYNARARQMFRYTTHPIDAYDGADGYAFIIASWRPMRLDQISTGGSWDTFELADEKYLSDPRPAIYELAAQLAGQNREAYTVEFARYTTTMPLYGSLAGGSSFGGLGGLTYCSGFGSGLGYSFIPASMFIPISSFTQNGYASSFYSRGQYFYYDDLSDCYRAGYAPGSYPGFYGYGYGYRVAGTGTPVTPTPMRGFNPRDRSPVVPNGVGAHTLPVSQHFTASNPQGRETPLPSPQYRQRGLITTDDPTTPLPNHRTPANDPRSGTDNHARPTIQDMVGRRPQNTGDGSGWSRAQSTAGNSAGNNDHRSFSPTSRRADPSTSDSRGSQGSQGAQSSQNEQRRFQPSQQQVEQHRSPPPQTETRSAPQVREAPSRPTPPVEMRSSPPPSPPPSAPPASSGSTGSSSSSSSTGRPPGPPSLH